MKKFGVFCISIIFMQSIQAETIWECSIADTNNMVWKFNNSYEKKALNIVLEGCKKQSKNPESCHKNNIICEEFVNGVSTTPLWICTALDAQANPWKGKTSTIKEDALFSAKSLCKTKSSVPETCYVYPLACINQHEMNL